MTQKEIYEKIGRLIVEKAQIINQANAKVLELDKQANELTILLANPKDNGK